MRKPIGIVLLILLCAALVGPVNAQLPLSPEDARKTSSLFDTSSPNSLNCNVQRWNPSLDFAFRFVSGHMINCRLAQFEGKATTLVSYLRITPEGKPPAFFGLAYDIPEISPEMKESLGGDLKKLKSEVSVSGAIGLGEGKYSVELLLKDGQNRSFRKKWRLNVSIRGDQRGVALAIKPLTAEPVDDQAWQTVPSLRGNLRLTIFLDAAPINPYHTTLRAWDRAFLLESVYSVLRQTPHRSVHLVAFNLDQQRELFRSDQFDGAAFQALAHALNESELSTVSVKVLKKRDSPEFLIALANQELAASRADAIIFLGPNTRMDTRVSAAALTEKQLGSPPFFYFEYFPWEAAPFPDSIDSLVRASGGKVFKVHSPAQLDQSIDKMLVQLKQE